MMKVTLRISGLLFGLVLWSVAAWAQPANDMCSGAIDLIVYDSEAEAIPVEGDTRNTTDGALDNIPVCSGNFFRDDVWYKIIAPAVISESGYTVKVYYNEFPDDIDSMGIAIYNSCDPVPANAAVFCANSPENDQASFCLAAGQEIYVRIWSAQGPGSNWQFGQGTFRIAVFPRTFQGGNTSIVLWGDEPGQGDFADGLNDWTTEGLLCNGTGAENAQWVWTSSGFPVYVFGGETVGAINSKSFCNGSVIFDSGYLMFGDSGTAGSGTCPWDDHEGAIISPVIDLSASNSAGVSVLFNQSMQRFAGGQHFLDFSLDGGATWEPIEINTEKTYLSTNPSTGGGYFNEEYRVRLPGAQNAPNLRIRFRFLGGAYWWVIDDVRIIETECNNTRVNSDWWTVAPWAILPADQVYPFPVMSDIENIGACTQSNVTLNHKVENGAGTVIYDENLVYGEVAADVKDENRLFPELVIVPGTAAMYTGTFSLTQDSSDYNTSDNTRSYQFAVGGNVFALEDGATRAIVPAGGNWTAGVTKSWAYGNFFYPVKNVIVDSITWGINNPVEMAGQIVNVILYQWTDVNNDNLANFQERKYVGFLEYEITGNEPPGETFSVTLVNFENEGEPIEMKANFGYIAMIEYVAPDATATVLELLGSDARDYRPLIFAFDSAYNAGLVDHKFYSSLLAIPMDGDLSQLDYGADRFGPTDLVPVIRIVTPLGTSTNEELPLDNVISAYPNPAIDQVQVKLEFSKPYSDVKIRLIDNLGRVVYYKALNQTISQHVESVSVKDLATGNYMLQIETPDGQRSVPVIVVK